MCCFEFELVDNVSLAGFWTAPDLVSASRVCEDCSKCSLAYASRCPLAVRVFPVQTSRTRSREQHRYSPASRALWKVMAGCPSSPKSTTALPVLKRGCLVLSLSLSFIFRLIESYAASESGRTKPLFQAFLPFMAAERLRRCWAKLQFSFGRHQRRL